VTDVHGCFGAKTRRTVMGSRPAGSKVVAIVTHRRTVEEVLANLGLLPRRPPLPPAQAPPKLALAL
jgi:hypothetical protein